MTIKDIFVTAISGGNYVVADMENKIDKLFIEGKLTEEERTELYTLTSAQAQDSAQIDVLAKLRELEDRIFALENPTETVVYPVWVSGYQTKQGEIVQYDYNKDNVMDLLRYDGGRSYTALSPGAIDGWHVVDTDGTILGTWYQGKFTPIDTVE